MLYNLVRKYHQRQLAQNEQDLIAYYIKRIDIRSLKLEFHAVERMEERGISVWDVKQALEDFEVIEYKEYTEGYRRFLVKGKATDKLGYRTCIVLDSKKNIVTTWKNHYTHKFEEVDMSNYTPR